MCSLEASGRGNRHRRAGVGGAAGGRDAGLDIERVETAGILQRMKARIAHPLEERGVGIEQPVEPIDQHADRAADRAASGRAGLRRAGGSGSTASRAVRRLRAFPARPGARSRPRAVRMSPALSAVMPVSLSSRADNCRASSLKALFSTGVRVGDFGSPIGRNGRTFFGISTGVSTGVSKSVGGEVSTASGTGHSAEPAVPVSRIEGEFAAESFARSA